MKVTVRLFSIANGGKMKCRASVTLFEEESDFQTRMDGFRVLEGDKGPWVGVPQERYWAGDLLKYKKTIRLNDVAQDLIFSAIISEYQKQFGK